MRACVRASPVERGPCPHVPGWRSGLGQFQNSPQLQSGQQANHQGVTHGAPRGHADGNVTHTVDFRRVYATVMQQWMGADSASLLNGRFETLPVFG